MASRITPRFSPYTYVRTNVMRTLLLKKEDYHKLMKMSVAEMTKYLQDRQYREDINALGVRYEGTELLEHALKNNLERSFTKLRRICDEDMLPLIDGYLKRHDVWNIKTILRALYTGDDKAKTREMLLVTAGPASEEFLLGLLNQKTFEDALEMLSKSEWKEAVKDHTTLMQVENGLDKQYYKELLVLADRLSSEGALFKRFIVTEIEILNLLVIMRMVREEVSPESIKELLFWVNGSRLNKLFEELITKKTVRGVVEASQKTMFKDSLNKGLLAYEKSGSLVDMERELRKYLLRISALFTHKGMLTFNVILGYMFEKEQEARNIRVIMKGRELGMSDAYIEQELVA